MNFCSQVKVQSDIPEIIYAVNETAQSVVCQGNCNDGGYDGGEVGGGDGEGDGGGGDCN